MRLSRRAVTTPPRQLNCAATSTSVIELVRLFFQNHRSNLEFSPQAVSWLHGHLHACSYPFWPLDSSNTGPSIFSTAHVGLGVNHGACNISLASPWNVLPLASSFADDMLAMLSLSFPSCGVALRIFNPLCGFHLSLGLGLLKRLLPI